MDLYSGKTLTSDMPRYNQYWLHIGEVLFVSVKRGTLVNPGNLWKTDLEW
jgi:hypothetical protein